MTLRFASRGCHVGSSSAGSLILIVGCPLYVHFGYPFTNEQLLSYPSSFGSRWDAMDDKMRVCFMDLVKDLEGKPLDGPTVLQVLKCDRSGFLACLSIRFALKFDVDGTAGDIVFMQIKYHMRPCLAATAGREKFTLDGSKTLLAEAAYELMDGTESVGSGAPFGKPFGPTASIVGSVGNSSQPFSSLDHATLCGQRHPAPDGYRLTIL